MSVMSTAGSGYFSSDRSIAEYAQNIWDIEPCRRSGPVPVDIEKVAQLIDLPTSKSYENFISSSPGVSMERLINKKDEEIVIKSCSPNPYHNPYM